MVMLFRLEVSEEDILLHIPPRNRFYFIFYFIFCLEIGFIWVCNFPVSELGNQYYFSVKKYNLFSLVPLKQNGPCHWLDHYADHPYIFHSMHSIGNNGYLSLSTSIPARLNWAEITKLSITLTVPNVISCYVILSHLTYLL